MNRRDFLLLRRDRSARIVELSCRQLYMRYLDAQVTGDRRGEEGDTVVDPWGSEPPAVFEERTFADVLRDLEPGLRDADVVRLRESEWLACGEVKRGLDDLLASFRARGGRVEWGKREEIQNSELGIENSSTHS
jgi:hypothetical protein